MNIYEKIYNRFDGKYGELVTEHCRILEQLKNCVETISGYEIGEEELLELEERVDNIEKTIGLWHN